MGKRNLYPTISTKKDKKKTRIFMDFLQYADGRNDLEAISKLIKIDNFYIKKIYNKLKKEGLVV